ncbi:hypothetical protein Tco_0755778 [Tanacetum coccineum]
MPPRMRTRSAGRPAAESLGGGTGVRVGRGGGVEDLGKEERIRVLGQSIPSATPNMHPKGLVPHASTITAQATRTRRKIVKPVASNNGVMVRGNKGNQARGRAFMLGAKEARQDPNIVTGFSYEIKVASGQLVEIDKVIKGYKLEIEGHVFDMDLIPFGHGSFDVIIGMD